MADVMAGGRLVAILTAHRASGLSYGAIAMRLFADHRIETTGPTLSRWAKELEIDTDTKEAVG
jgi:hypothetical protein